MGALNLVAFVLGMFGTKKKERNEESLEELKLRDCIRREEKQRSKEKGKLMKTEGQEKKDSEKRIQQDSAGQNPYEKAARMLKTERRRK